MRIIDEKIIDSITENIETQSGNKGTILWKDDLLFQSQEVEVLDIGELFNNFRDNNKCGESFSDFCIRNGYKLINIKE